MHCMILLMCVINIYDFGIIEGKEDSETPSLSLLGEQSTVNDLCDRPISCNKSMVCKI